VRGLWAILAVCAVGRLGAQTDTDAVRDSTRRQLETLLSTYGPAREMRFQRSADQPFDIVGVFDKPMLYVSRLEIIVTVTGERTIGFRVYPRLHGAHINLDRVRRRTLFMERLLRDADQSFLHWAIDQNRDLFAGFTFTLESGFPEDAIEMVIRSIPLLDRPVGELIPLIQ
jgi:hypothetical protein